MQHVLDVLEQAARKLPTGTLISGAIGAEAFFDPACTPAALDRVAPGDAVVLDTLSAHAGILNLAAAKKFGARTNGPPPLAGWYGKDMKSRQWDGVVHQAAWTRISELLMSDRSHQDAELRAFLEGEIKWGVTSITLMESYPAHRVEQLAVIDSPLRVRIVPFLTYQEVDQRRKPEYPEVPTQLMERVTVNGEKWMLDSNPFERSGGMRQPYADDPTSSGQVDFSPVEIRAILEGSLQHNRPLLLHAVGDRTTETLLNQMEASGGAKTWSQRRLRIEHGDGLMPDLMPRAKNLGVIVVENPTHFAFGELFVRRYGPERAAVMLPLHSLMDAGMPLVIATDGVVGIPILNPYLSLMFASAYPGKLKESLTREQAVTAFTATAAYAEFAASSKGTLEPGKFADLAVLSQDIFRVPLQELPKTESVLPIVGGKIAFTSGLLTAK